MDASATHVFQQEALLSSILENTQANLTLFEPVRDETGQVIDFRYIFTNPANARMTGRTVAEMTGNCMFELFPALRATEFYDRILHTAETGETSQFVFRFKADGVDGWFDTIFSRHGDTILFTCLDVTAIKRAELEQQRQNQWLNTMIDSSLMGNCYFGVLREHGEIVDFVYKRLNPVHAETLGRTVDELIGRRLLAEYPGSIDSGLFALLKLALETGDTQRFIMHYDTDGLDIWGDVQLIKLDDGVLMSYLNITDLKQAIVQQQRQSRQLEMANVELQRSNDHLQEFAYVASHDLQEPLRKIQSFTNIIRTEHGHELSGRADDMLNRMQRAAERMSRLIYDLLTFSRLNNQQVNFQPVLLDKVVYEVVSDMGVAIQEQQARVQIGELPVVLGNPGQLRQLMQNLIGNALKFVAPGQSPEITVTSKLLPLIELPPIIRRTVEVGECADQYWEVSVRDNGIGFDEKYLDRLFMMFQRLHGRSQYEGSGMGLAICKRVVDNHRGCITAQSRPSEGATFMVYLPG